MFLLPSSSSAQYPNEPLFVSPVKDRATTIIVTKASIPLS